MQIRQFHTPGLSIYSYLIYDEKTSKAAVIDPTRQIEKYLARAIQDKVEITDIFETHVHADFASGALELKAALEGKPKIHCSGMGGKEWSPSYADHLVKDGEVINVGGMTFTACHTPGHTPEHMAWIATDLARGKTPSALFSGDLLFVGSVGRPDLLGDVIEEKLAKDLYNSLYHTLSSLPDYLQVYPAHGADSLCGKGIGSRESSTIGFEKQCNPFLKPQPFEEWHAALLKEMPPIPNYFKRMKTINSKGLKNVWGHEMPPRLNQEELDEHLDHAIIVDTRSSSDFANCHIKGAINVPFCPNFSTWIGSVLKGDEEIILMVDSAHDILPVVQALRLIAFDHIRGICIARGWHFSPTDRHSQLSTLSAAELKQNFNQYYILDVRQDQEWESKHIEGAHHLEMTKIASSLDKIPKKKPLAVICRGGNRASVIASYLVNHGYSASNVAGGMTAWQKLAGGS